MNLPRKFEEYIRMRIVLNGAINKSRAEFLIMEAEKSFNGLKKRLEIMGIDEDNSNSIVKDCYDILMELIRANLLLKGYNSSGQFAHEAEVAYFKKLNFSDNETSFLNDLRYFRNSVTYYGKILTVEYAVKVVIFTKRIYPQLVNIINL